MNQNWLRLFSYTSNCWLLCFSYGGIIREEDPKDMLLVAQYHKTKVWTQCLSQPHTTWAQFFVIVPHHGCRLLETWVAVDKSPKSNKQQKNWRECRLHVCPLWRPCGSGMNCTMVRKKYVPLLHAVPLLHCMNGIIHIFYVRDFCHCRCHGASVLRVWIHSLGGEHCTVKCESPLHPFGSKALHTRCRNELIQHA